LVASFGQADRDGAYQVQPPLPRGQTYSVIVAAKGYKILAQDDVLDIGTDTSAQVQLDPIQLTGN
jgi:hypothetical protein